MAVHQFALPYLMVKGCSVVCFLDGQQQPGSASDQLAVVSSLKPGFTTASAEDYKSYPVMELSQDLPDVIITQMAKLSDFARSAKYTVTLGPRFGPDVGTSAMAADFLNGLTELVRTGRLSSGSDFVRQLRAALAEAARAGRLDIEHIAQPSTELEREIAVAVQLSLGAGPVEAPAR